MAAGHAPGGSRCAVPGAGRWCVDVKKRDYYEVLGIDRQADETAIKKAYRDLAKKHHPDRNPGDKQAEERFKQASEAYAVLIDAQKRRRYDQFGHAGLGGGEGFGGFNPEIFADFEDVLGSFFGFSMGDPFGGGHKSRGGARRGSDLRYDLTIEFMEAARGTEKEIRIPRLESCGDCRGSGSRSGKRGTCRTCGGRGQVIQQQGFFTLSRACSACGGSGQEVTDPCPACHGEGRRRAVRMIKVKIPAGVDTGSRLRISGEGEGGLMGGRAGDLYVALTVRDHPVFRRDGQDLGGELSLTVAQAALGTALNVPTLEGEESIEIAAGTQSGATFRLRGKGLPHPGGGPHGDLFITISVRVPSRLNRKQREAYEKLRELEDPPEKGSRDLFDRVKDIFS